MDDFFLRGSVNRLCGPGSAQSLPWIPIRHENYERDAKKKIGIRIGFAINIPVTPGSGFERGK
jgi:hypothetical protein